MAANGKFRKRTEAMAFYVTREEREQIVKNASDSDMSFSDYARKVLLGKVPNKWMPETVRKDELA